LTLDDLKTIMLKFSPQNANITIAEDDAMDVFGV
jgi:hypothetical protein